MWLRSWWTSVRPGYKPVKRGPTYQSQGKHGVLSHDEAAELCEWPWAGWDSMSLVELPQGQTVVFKAQARCRGGEPSRGTLVLLHGITTGSIVWRTFGADLARAGWDVIAYNLPGRGPADAEIGSVQTVDYFVEQLEALVAELGLKRFALCGYSLGAPIAASYCAKYGPERIERLVVVAPAGYPAPVPMTTALLRIPLVDQLFYTFLGRWILFGQTAKGVKSKKELVQRSQARMQLIWDRNPAFRRSLLSTLKHFELHALGERYAALATHSYPVGVVWGEHDVRAPFSNWARLSADIPRATLFPVEDMGHNLGEQPERVSERLVAALL